MEVRRRVERGVWIRGGFTEVAGGHPLERFERQVYHPLQCGNPKVLKSEECFMNPLVGKRFELTGGCLWLLFLPVSVTIHVLLQI